MPTASRLFVLAAAVAAPLLSTGCSGEASARDVLQQQGYTEIELERDGGNSFQFSATKDGGECSGSVEVSGALGFSRSQVSAQCVSSSRIPVERREADEVAPASPPPAAAPQRAPLVVVFGEDFTYDRPSIEIEAPPASGSAIAASLLEAIAAGDRVWIAEHCGEHLRRNILEDSVTPMQVSLTRLRGLSLFPSGGGRTEAGYEVSKFALSAEGHEAIELSIVFDDHGFQGVHFDGPGWPESAALFDESELQVHGQYYVGADGVPMNEPLVPEGADLNAFLSMSHGARRDGKVEFDYQIIHTYAGNTDTFNAEPASIETPGPFHVRVNVPTPEPGEHHIEVRVHDRITDAVLAHEFTAAVTRP